MSAPIDRTIDTLESAGCQPRRIGNGWQAHCPSHDDREPSLSIGEGADDKVLLRCHAGCEPEAIVAALGLVWGDLFARKDDLPDAPNPERDLETFCERRKLTRKELSRWRVEEVTVHDRPALKIPTRLGVDRIKFLDGRAPKVMWAERGKGRAHPYGLTRAQRIGGETLYIVNGEPSVWACSQSNVPAVCTAAGEGVALGPDALAELAGSGFAKLAVVYDRDQAGRDGAHKLVLALRDAGLDARALELPARLGPGGDVDDLHRLVGDTGLVRALAELPELRAALAAVPDPLEPLRHVKDAESLEKALRDLKAATGHLDSIGRQVCRERAIEALKAADLKVTSPSKLIDAALGSEIDAAEAAAGAGILVLADQAPWDEPVDGVTLLDSIRTQLLRYLILRPGCDVAVTLWTIHAHALEASFNSPRLTITSPIPECGKTTLCNVLAKLTPRPYRVINPTPATMYRVIDVFSPTTFIDEADNIDFFENRDLMSIIDAGFDRDSAAVPRCVGEDQEVKLFSVWCPLVLAQAKKRIPPQIESRSIVIQMDRIGPGEHVDHLRPDRLGHLVDLNRRCVRWVADHLAELKAADPTMPAGLRSRRIDKWRGLLAIADRVGGEWPEIARKAAVALESGDRDDSASWSVLALRDLEDMFTDQKVGVLTSEQIVKHFATIDTRPWVEFRHGKPITQRQLAALLNTFEIAPQTVRVGTGTARGYRFETCSEVFTRYRGVHDPTRQHNVDDHCVFGVSRSDTTPDPVSDRNSRKVNADSACVGVSDCAGVSGEDRAPWDDDVEVF